MLELPVTFQSTDSSSSTRIVTLRLLATSSLQDLETAVQDQLEPDEVLIALLYRRCQPLLSSPLLDFTVSGENVQPRFQALFKRSLSIVCIVPLVLRSEP